MCTSCAALTTLKVAALREFWEQRAVEGLLHPWYGHHQRQIRHSLGADFWATYLDNGLELRGKPDICALTGTH